MKNLCHPITSLLEGNWFKLICGASFQSLPDIRTLAIAYTLAGVDCIDVAADPAVVAAVKEALQVAGNLRETAAKRGFQVNSSPLLMVSLNDGEDPHFRKAEFDPNDCPADCPRPCVAVCPADAIDLDDRSGNQIGVIDRRCYGCGRCLPICPQQLIFARSYVSNPYSIANTIEQMNIDAIEIHTSVGNLEGFRRLWQAIAPKIDRLKLLSISCRDRPGLIDYLYSLYDLITPVPFPLIWQTDGRPMSGDIGMGTTHAAIELAQKVLTANLPGFVQLAGGTNHYTVSKLQLAGMLKQAIKNRENKPFSFEFDNSNMPCPYVAGIAYGSYARSLLTPIIEQLEHEKSSILDTNIDRIISKPTNLNRLEECPDLLWYAVEIADQLVNQIKQIK